MQRVAASLILIATMSAVGCAMLPDARPARADAGANIVALDAAVDVAGLDAAVADQGAPDDGALSDGGEVAPADLARPLDLGPVGCEALLVCLADCAPGDGTCSGVCRRRASAAAKALLAAADQCADDACIAATRCSSASDDSVACDVCFSNASSGGATGVACVPANDPICGACADEWLACETD